MKVCVYTGLFGGYEALNEQPMALETNIPFICFTDDNQLESETWQISHVEPMFAMDSVRSQRVYKILPHKFLSEYDVTIYIDNSVILTAPPEDILEKYWSTSELCVLQHSYRESVLDEFVEVSRLGFDDQNRIFEQLNHYTMSENEILNQKPYWGGILIRDNNCDLVKVFNDIWYAHVMRYSRRDQLSINMAIVMSGVEPHVIIEDNDKSWFHTWRNFSNRDKNKIDINLESVLMPQFARLRKLELEVDDLRTRYIQANAEIDNMIKTYSWRITLPLRKLASFFLGKY